MRPRNPIYRSVKKAIKKDFFPDPYFVAKYHFSPYMGCEHGCVYCDGRAEKYFVEGDYEKDIVVRRNLIDSLQKELSKLREPGKIFIGSGISDVYQPIEKEEKLMQQSAELLLQHDFGVAVLTKSSLIERDFSAWEELHQQKQFTLLMTLITVDDTLRKQFEPEASSIEERLATLQKFKQAGMAVGVLIMPLLPYLSDSAEDFQKLLKRLRKIPVDFVLPGLLTLRPGRQKDLFLEKIAAYYPHLSPKYNHLYRKNSASGSPDFEYCRQKYVEIQRLIRQAGLLTNQPIHSYRGQFALYDEIYILLGNLKELYRYRPENIARLQVAIKKYEQFIRPFKQKLNRSRKLSYHVLEDIVREKLRNKDMEKILNNKKLAYFLYQIFIEKKNFNEETLKFGCEHAK